MSKIIKYLVCLIIMSMLAMQVETVLAAVENYPVTSWSADDMEIGNTTGANGLEFVQSEDITDIMVTVNNKGRHNEVGSYDQSINTGGSANMLTQYVPRAKAVKFTVTQPCNVVIYAYGASDVGNLSMKLSGENKLIDTFTVQHSVLARYQSFIDSAGTYYIYSQQGALGICEIKVGYVCGDVDVDFDVDWNDLRLAKRVFNNLISADDLMLERINVDGNSALTSNDISTIYTMTDNMGKAYFTGAKCWNANNMTAGYPEVCDGLELVYKDDDVTNHSMRIVALNKTYYGTKGDVRDYTKCIATDGAESKGIGNYAVTKAVKFNLESDAYVTMYLNTGSSKNIQHKAKIIDADGNKVSEFNINKDIGRYTVRLDGCQTYFLCSPTGTLRIYEIEVNTDVLNTTEQVSKSISVTNGNTYIYTLTMSNAAVMDSAVFTFEYNNNDVELVSVGGVEIGGLWGKNESGIIAVDIATGMLSFKTDNLANGESGIITDVELKANRNCTTTLILSMEGRDNV